MAKKRTTGLDSGLSGTGAAPSRSRRKRNAPGVVPVAENPVAESVSEVAVAPQSNGTSESNSTAQRVPTSDEIARLAYAYWVERGCQGGSAEEDWLRAERELRAQNVSMAAEA